MKQLVSKSSSPAFLRYLLGLRWTGLAALAALALTPLIFDPAARDDAFFTPKWAWMAGWTALGLAAVAGRMLAGRAATFPLNEIWIGAFVFALWHWVAVLWARSPSLGLDRAWAMTMLTLALWLGTQLNLRRRVLPAIAWAWTGVAVATAVWVLAQDGLRAWAPGMGVTRAAQAAGVALALWFGALFFPRPGANRWAGAGKVAGLCLAAWFGLGALLPPGMQIKSNLEDWRGTLTAGLGSTSHIGDLLALALLPALTLFGEARTRMAKALLFAAALLLPAGLIVSFSVGSNFGLIAGAALMAGLMIWRDRGRWFARRKGRWIALAAAWAVLILFFVLPHPANPHRQGILNEGYGSGRWVAGGPTRLAIWAQTLEMIRLHPLLGVGTGNFTYVFPEMDSRMLWGRPDLRKYQGQYTNAAHNEILQTWTELGIAGLFFFLALVALAFYSLLRGLRWADPRSFLIRITLAGLLLAWLAQAQMNFSLQHPAGALTFYTLLLAAVLEKRTRPGVPTFPSLSQQFGPLMVRLDCQSMTKPTALAFSFALPRALGVGLGLALIAGALAWGIGWRVRPVRAQREYQRGYALERIQPAEAERHFQRALALYPNAHDVRSHYSDWLIKNGRPADGLKELAVVRRRLNSNELWEREARGLAGVGRKEDARRAMETYFKRLWLARVMTNGGQ